MSSFDFSKSGSVRISKDLLDEPQVAKTFDTLQVRDLVSIAGKTSLFTYVGSLGGTQTYFFMKRLMDIVLSGLALLILSPLFLIIALAIRFDSSGTVIFKQERIGSKRIYKDGKHVWVVVPFTIYKFRTMQNGASANLHRDFVKAFMRNDFDQMKAMQNHDKEQIGTFKLNDDPRVTRVGKWLRRTSLDELPQLMNVFLGTMSLVGPRPALSYEVEDYQDWQLMRLSCKQGITGYWQVTGRSETVFEGMVRQDIWYAYHQSLWLDLMILLKTPAAVLSGKGAG